MDDIAARAELDGELDQHTADDGDAMGNRVWLTFEEGGVSALVKT